jgi:hypothetical protein
MTQKIMQKIIIIFSAALLFLTNFLSFAMEDKEPRTISDIAPWCEHIFDKIMNESRFQGDIINFGYYSTRCIGCKVISFSNFDDPSIFKIIHSESHSLLEREKRHAIYSFNERLNDRIRSFNREWIEFGLIFAAKTEKELETPSHEAKTHYKTVIDKLRKGWKTANIENFPQIVIKRDSKEWSLFTKQKLLYNEECLFRFLAAKFGLSEIAFCHDFHKDDPRTEINFTALKDYKVYLWVKKDQIEKFNNIFQFEFDTNC